MELIYADQILFPVSKALFKTALNKMQLKTYFKYQTWILTSILSL